MTDDPYESLTTAEISKLVGYDQRLIKNYPTLAEVKLSTRVDRCRWNRYLISPSTKEEHDVLSTIIEMGF